MNDILSFFLSAIYLLPYLILPSIIPGIFILNQAAKQRSFIKTLPSVIVASICYNILIHVIVFDNDFFYIFMIWWIEVPLFISGFIFLIYMGYNTWNQSYFSLTAESKSVSILKQISVAISISILSILNPYILDILIIGFYKYQGNDIKIIYMFVFIWFLSLAMVGYNIRKLEKGPIILTVTNKIVAVMIWCIALYNTSGLISVVMWLKHV